MTQALVLQASRFTHSEPVPLRPFREWAQHQQVQKTSTSEGSGERWQTEVKERLNKLYEQQFAGVQPDEEDNEPISYESLCSAVRLLELLPDSPKPTRVRADQEGGIEFVWRPSEDQSFMIAVDDFEIVALNIPMEADGWIIGETTIDNEINVGNLIREVAG